jgi:hypothetical protein
MARAAMINGVTGEYTFISTRQDLVLFEEGKALLKTLEGSRYSTGG